jgi:hypothetical protein
MKPVRVVSDKDIADAFREGQPSENQRRKAAAAEKLMPFKKCWQQHLGELFEVPSDSQIFMWRKMAGFDEGLLVECILDLRRRALSPLNADDPWGHALRHFSAVLIRRTKAKYGKVRPLAVAA